MRIKLVLSYDGTDFFGSQSQKTTGKTILGTLQNALLTLNITNTPVASGRTDKGVHATGQVCHLDLPAYWSDLEKLKKRLNTILPNAIHIRKIEPVADDFHARYSAKKRLYRYIMHFGEPTPFLSRYVTYTSPFDLQELHNKLTLFEGEHDFAFFQKSGSDVASTRRIIYKTLLYKHKEYIILTFEANGFLRAQIRLMVAALLQLSANEINEMLRLHKRYKLKPVAANGLYLAKIKYQE